MYLAALVLVGSHEDGFHGFPCKCPLSTERIQLMSRSDAGTGSVDQRNDGSLG